MELLIEIGPFLFQLHPGLLQEFHLLVQRIHLKFQFRKGTFQFFSAFCFFFQLRLCIQLSLSDFFYKYLADLYIRNIPVFDDLFFNFFDKFWSDRFSFLCRKFCNLPWISLQNTLEHSIIGDKIDIHLQKIFFIELQGRVPLFNGIAHFIIAFDKLPEPVTGAVIRIFHHKVCSLDRTVYSGTAVHDIAERAGSQRS